MGPVESRGKKENARSIMEMVNARENGFPDSRTPLAIWGQPANNRMDKRIREKT